VVVAVTNGVVVPVGGGLGAGGAVVLLIGVVVAVGVGLGVLPLGVTGSVTPLVGPASVLPVVTAAAGDGLAATLLGLVVAGLAPSEPGAVPPELAEPDGDWDEAGPLDEPELAVVGLVEPLVGLGLVPAEPAELDAAGPAEPDGDGDEAGPLDEPELAVVGVVKPLVGLGLAPAEPAELDAAEPSPAGDAVVGVRPAALAPAAASVTPPVPSAPDAPAPEAVALFAKIDVTGAVPDGAEAPAPPLATVFGVAAPIDIWITGTGPVENLPDPVAVTPLPSTLYISR
jgi:hypothetical protein